MFVLIFCVCLCTLIIIGWKFLLISSKNLEQSQNSIVSTEEDNNNQTSIICDKFIVRKTLEILPDEILLDIISYLKPYDIYHGFFNLNERFNSIINDFQLDFHFDISHISKNEFDYCLLSILSQSSVQLRLQSLHLSNDETYGAIARFLRSYPNLSLPYLRSLSIIDANTEQIKILLFRLSTNQLESISLLTNRTIDINDKRLICEILLKHKSLRSCHLSLCDGVDCDETILNNPINNQLENIIIDLSYFQNILTLLSYIPNVKYLTININQQKYYNQDYDAAAFDIVRLSIPTQLTYFNLNLKFSNVEFEHIEQLLTCLVNLKHLCCSSFRAELIDGYRWASVLEHLPLLRRFECVMTTYIYHSLDLKLISESFQTLFWKNKNWSVICDYFQCLSRLTIYTIPFYKTLFISTLNGSQLIQNHILPENAFDKVTHLKISVQGLYSENIPSRIFRSVTSLSLCDGESYSDHSNSSLLSYLTATVDLTKIRHLKLYSLLSGHTLFSLLCKAPNINCLSSSYHNLLQMINDFGDVWLCWLLNMMIKRLTLSYGRLTLSIVNQFIELFSNIEHLSLCMNVDDIDFQEILLRLLQNLTHLSSIRISLAGKLTYTFQSQTLIWLSNHHHLHSEFNDNFLDIWIS